MNKKILVTTLSLLFSSFSFAQTSDATADSLQDVFDLPESILISEEDLMNDYTNKSNLTPGTDVYQTLSYDDSIIVSRLSRIPTTIEMPLNNVTRKYIELYSNKLKGSVGVMLGASNFYNPIFEEALEKYGLPLELKYLPVIESALRPSATSRVGAAGLWQFMLATGKRYGLEVNTLVDERRDPIKSSEAAAHYLRDLYDTFGDWGLAIAAYNCGEGNIQKAILRSGNPEGADYWSVYNKLPKETRGYVPAFIAATYIMNYYCEHGITPHETTLPEETDTVLVQKELPFSQIASLCNISVDQIRAINPQYRKDIVPANYTLKLPDTIVEEFVLKEDSIYGSLLHASGNRRVVTEDVEETEIKTAQTSRSRSSRSRNVSSAASKSVTVRGGDTLSSIAKRNGTTVDKLRKLNGIKGDMIRPNQKIRVK